MNPIKLPAYIQSVSYTEETLVAAVGKAHDDLGLPSEGYKPHAGVHNVSLLLAVPFIASALWLHEKSPRDYPVIWKAYTDLSEHSVFLYEGNTWVKKPKD
jgi:hypothetical protein